jgi:DNA-binding GntR family transcriptional regulator
MNPGELVTVVQRTLSDAAAERLRAAIKHGSLVPGMRLVERDLAQRLGVSRIPIREAIQRLVEEGLVTKLAHRGTFVAMLSRNELEEISSLRIVLERFVVARAIERWSPEQEAHLRVIVKDMYAAATARNVQLLSERDAQFHHALWKLTEHNLLLEVVSSLRSRISRFLSEATSALPASELTTHATAHSQLIDILSSGDLERAQDAITTHIVDAKQRILAYYEQIWLPDNTRELPSIE